MTTVQAPPTEREQTIAGLLALVDLIESGTVPPPGGIELFFLGTPEDVERVAAVHELDVRRYEYKGKDVCPATIKLGHVGCHPVQYKAYAEMLSVLVDRNGDILDGLYGCECDVDRPCSVAQCQMERASEYTVRSFA